MADSESERGEMRLIECCMRTGEKDFMVWRVVVAKDATCHTLRRSFATHVLAGGHGIRTVYELLGRNDVRTTLIYCSEQKYGHIYHPILSLRGAVLWRRSNPRRGPANSAIASSPESGSSQ
jgi:integrase